MNNKQKAYQDLIVQRMKMDKFFSDFLEANELDDDDYSTPAWLTYKAKLREYYELVDTITAAEYQLGR